MILASYRFFFFKFGVSQTTSTTLAQRLGEKAHQVFGLMFFCIAVLSLVIQLVGREETARILKDHQLRLSWIAMTPMIRMSKLLPQP